jgi:hypothetical protein
MGLTTANVLEGQTDNEPPIVEEEAPHLMRITTHGKLRAFVTFALKFLEARVFHPLFTIAKLNAASE